VNSPSVSKLTPSDGKSRAARNVTNSFRSYALTVFGDFSMFVSHAR
jgi:hypothetical protein